MNSQHRANPRLEIRPGHTQNLLVIRHDLGRGEIDDADADLDDRRNAMQASAMPFRNSWTASSFWMARVVCPVRALTGRLTSRRELAYHTA
jgi:hypothetical protein